MLAEPRADATQQGYVNLTAARVQLKFRKPPALSGMAQATGPERFGASRRP
jgi:hypothetical protein